MLASFQSLLDSKTDGTFFLKNTLRDHTDERRLQRIMHEVDKILDEHKVNYSPSFCFVPKSEAVMEMLVIDPRKAAKDTSAARLGSLNLVVTKPKEISYPVLALQGTTWDSVARRKQRGVQFKTVKNKVQYLSEILSPSRYLLLTNHISMLERLVGGENKDYTFDIEITDDAVQIVAYEKGSLLTTISVSN